MPNKGSGKPDYGEPWKVTHDYYLTQIIKRRGQQVMRDVQDGEHFELDAIISDRIVSCVNACAGLTDEELKRVRAVNEMYEALLQCSRDTFTASGGMSESGKISPAGQRYKKAMAALTVADGREPERGER